MGSSYAFFKDETSCWFGAIYSYPYRHQHRPSPPTVCHTWSGDSLTWQENPAVQASLFVGQHSPKTTSGCHLGTRGVVYAGGKQHAKTLFSLCLGLGFHVRFSFAARWRVFIETLMHETEMNRPIPIWIFIQECQREEREEGRFVTKGKEGWCSSHRCFRKKVTWEHLLTHNVEAAVPPTYTTSTQREAGRSPWPDTPWT